MFPGMHRRLQQLNGARAYEILAQAPRAVLSVTDSVELRLFGADQPHSRRNHLYIYSPPMEHKSRL